MQVLLRKNDRLMKLEVNTDSSDVKKLLGTYTAINKALTQPVTQATATSIMLRCQCGSVLAVLGPLVAVVTVTMTGGVCTHACPHYWGQRGNRATL